MLPNAPQCPPMHQSPCFTPLRSPYEIQYDSNEKNGAKNAAAEVHRNLQLQERNSVVPEAALGVGALSHDGSGAIGGIVNTRRRSTRFTDCLCKRHCPFIFP
jgi:hypothetical protein